MLKLKKTIRDLKGRTERNWASHIPARIPWRDEDEISKGPGGRGIDDLLSEPYVGKLAWVQREIIVDSEQEEPLTRGFRSKYMLTVNVMSDGFKWAE